MFEVSRLRDSMEPESSLWIALDSGSSEGSKMCCRKSVGLDLTLMNSRKKWPWGSLCVLRVLRGSCSRIVLWTGKAMESCIEYRHFNERKYRGWHKKQNRYRNWSKLTWIYRPQFVKTSSGRYSAPLHFGARYWQKILDQQSGMAARGGALQVSVLCLISPSCILWKRALCWPCYFQIFSGY